MASKLYEETAIQQIANAIREKNGGTDTYKVSEMATAIAGLSGSEPLVEFSQVNSNVTNYLNTDYSTDTNRSTSTVDTYAPNGDTERCDMPNGAEVEVSNGTLDIVDHTNKRLTSKEVTAGTETICNITPSANGGLFAIRNNGNVSKVGMLKPTGSIRMLKTPSVQNVRDFGGWDCDGGTVKYGKLFRGGHLASSDGITITDDDKRIYKELLGVGCEIDFSMPYDKPSGGLSSSPLGSHVEYIPYQTELIYQPLFDYDGDGKAIIKEAMEKIFNNVKRDIPTYIHCVYGKDRTGTIALLIEALLGVGESDVDKDYELSSFTNKNFSWRRYRTDERWKNAVAYLKSTTNSTSLRDGAVAYCVLIGLKIEDINEFRRNMIDGTPANVSANINYTANSLLLDKTEITLDAGKTATIRALLKPTWATSVLTWTSSDSGKVSVVGSGDTATITTIAGGNVTITAKLPNGASASCIVTVASRLPSEYQEVEYIQSTGTQYIDTGVIGATDIEMDATFTINEFGDTYLLGSTDGTNRMLFALQSNPLVWRIGQNVAAANDKLPALGEQHRYICSWTSNGATINCVTLNRTNTLSVSGAYTNSLNLYIFCRNNKGGTSGFGKVKLYSMKLKSNGTLVRDFVPCYRKSDNVIGLYDIVNGTFYTNKGSGTFTKGANV